MTTFQELFLPPKKSNSIAFLSPQQLKIGRANKLLTSFKGILQRKLPPPKQVLLSWTKHFCYFSAVKFDKKLHTQQPFQTNRIFSTFCVQKTGDNSKRRNFSFFSSLKEDIYFFNDDTNTHFNSTYLLY